MASVQELRRVIDIRSRTTGVNESAADLKKLDAAYTGVTIESAKLERATLSVDRQFAALQRKLDPTIRSTERLAAAERTLNAAHAQGLITLARKNELLALSTAQTDRATAATSRFAVASRAAFGIAAGVTFAAIGVRAIKEVVDQASELVDVADKIGITTKGLQELKFAGAQSGVEFSELSGGLSYFNKAIGEAARGGGDLLKILKANGVAVRDQSGAIRPLMDLLGDYADLVAGAGDAQDRTTLVTKAFGRANDELINTLSGGAGGLRAFADEANRSGLILEDGLLRRSEELGDRWDKFMSQLTVGWQTFVLSVVDGVSTIEAAYARLQAMKPPPGTIFGGGVSTAGGGQYPSIVPPDLLAAGLGGSTSKKVVIDFEGRFNPPLAKTIVPEVDKTVKAIDATLNGVKVPLPNLRPEIDNVAKSLERAEDQARGFVETLVGGLADGDGVIGSLTDAVKGLTSSLGTTLGDKVSGLIGGATSGIFGSILSGLGGGLVSSLVSGIGSLFGDLFGDNDEEERLRRKEERARRQEARDRREAKLEAKEDARLAREEKRLAKQEASARRVESFEDRAFSAGLDTTTLEGQLAQFDREAQREREELARTAGKKYNKEVIALDKALAAERLQIQEDFNDELVAEAKRAQDEINQVARSIVDYVNGLNTGSESTLSPQDRYTAASAAFQSQLALAQGGNLDAQSSITQYADAFLKASRDMFASSTAFQNDFDLVKSALLALPAVQQSDDPVVVALLAAQNAIVSSVDLMRTTLNAAINAGPAATAAAMAPNFEAIDVNVDGGITLAEMQTALGTTNTRLQSIFTTLDADGSGTISKLELIRAQAVATNTNTSNTATRVNGVAKDTSLTSPTKGLPKVADATALTLPQQLENLNVAIVVLQQLIGGLSQSQITLFKQLIKAIKNSPNYATGGMIPAYDAGGMVGNGIYNVDSVRARYAGGGDIMLAGGEFVTRATSVNAMTMPILDAINRTGRPASNDNGGVAAMTNVIHADFGNLMRVQLSTMRALIETLQSENAMLRAEVRSGSERTTRAVKDKPVAKPQAKRA